MKQELSVSDFSKICRLCLQENNELIQLLPIFKSDSITETSSENVLANICELVDSETSPLDDLPQHICNECDSSLNKLLTFRNACRNSIDILKYVLKTTRPETIFIRDKSPLPDPDPHPDYNVTNNELVQTAVIKCNKIKSKLENRKLIDKAKSKRSPQLHMCELCGAYVLNISQHRASHNPGSTVKCDECQKSFKSHRIFREHKLIVHKKDRSAVCNVCQASFKTQYNLNRHMKIHEYGESDKITCEYCGRLFLDQSALSTHRISHRTILDFKCKYCDKRFKCLKHLNRHIPTHTGEKRHTCGICPMRFTLSSKAAMHRRTHKINDKFVCDICSMDFTLIRYYRMHREEAHGLKTDIGDVSNLNLGIENGESANIIAKEL